MEVRELTNRPIPYAVTRSYCGGVQRYAGEVGYCDLIASEITPENIAAIEARLIAEASAALGQEVQIVETVPCTDIQFGEVLKVLFEPIRRGRAAAHLASMQVPLVAAA